MLNNQSSRRVIIAGNWKMHKLRDEAVELATQIVEAVGKIAAGKDNMPQIFLFPPSTSLEYVSTAVKGTGIITGAQNMNQHESGGYTGEISAGMIIDCGGQAVLVGDSERRHIFHETDTDVNAKLKRAMDKKLIAILCAGETLEQREAGKTDEVIEQQITIAVSGVTFSNTNNLIIAYEPVWSIGTGKVCEPEEADRVIGKIREILRLNDATMGFADKVPILYGGSVKPDNVAAQLLQENIDGVLVGGASLTAAEFVPIIEAGTQCRQVERTPERL